jgi:ferritin-like metal-binding protein YciE
MKTMDDLFLHHLKDIYYAEKQILKALPKMVKATKSPELAEAFETHRQETEGQVQRLEQIFEILDKPARGVKCEAIEGLIAEAKEVMDEAKESGVLDAGLLASAQAVEHYEIARYGTMSAWANQLGLSKAVKLLEQTLEQEKAADRLLTRLAESAVNAEAA